MIRAFKAQDQSRVKKLISSILDKEFEQESNSYMYGDLDDIESSYGGERDLFLVSMQGDNVVGTIALKEDDTSVALLRRLFVGSLYRHKGYGVKLLERALKFAKDQGYQKIVFRCTDRMVGAINLMLKKGFKETSIIDMGDYKIYLLEKEI